MNEVTTDDAGTIADDNLERAAQAFPAQDVATVERGQSLAVPTPGDEINWGSVLTAMLEKCSDPQFDEKKLVVMKDVVREWRQDDAKQWFARDLSAAQAECKAVVRASEVRLITKEKEDKGGYDFASENDIDEMLRPIETKYGFAITHDRVPRQGDGGGLVVKSTLWHRSGHSITAEFPLALDSGAGKNNLQAAGSTDSYGRKYNRLGFFDVIRKGQDDDGAAGGVMPLSTDADGRKKAERLRQLVEEAGIGEDSETPLDRKAARVGWFHERLDYQISNYLDIRQEDYLKMVRLLRIEKQAKDVLDRKGAEV